MRPLSFERPAASVAGAWPALEAQPLSRSAAQPLRLRADQRITVDQPAKPARHIGHMAVAHGSGWRAPMRADYADQLASFQRGFRVESINRDRLENVPGASANTSGHVMCSKVSAQDCTP